MGGGKGRRKRKARGCSKDRGEWLFAETKGRWRKKGANPRNGIPIEKGKDGE